ncbi:hypothetical protein BC831DRAFT_476366, partial [Entophlyctis helioformis]
MADLPVAGKPPIAARQQRFQRVLASLTRSRRGDGAAAAMTCAWPSQHPPAATMRRCDDGGHSACA